MWTVRTDNNFAAHTVSEIFMEQMTRDLWNTSCTPTHRRTNLKVWAATVLPPSGSRLGAYPPTPICNLQVTSVPVFCPPSPSQWSTYVSVTAPCSRSYDGSFDVVHVFFIVCLALTPMESRSGHYAACGEAVLTWELRSSVSAVSRVHGALNG